MRRGGRRNERGFWLLEAVLAVAIFSIGIIALAGAVNNCLVAQKVKQDEVRARRALGNRMAEIEAGAVKLADATDDLKGAFEGMRLKQTRVPLERKTEKEQEITGIDRVNLEVSWEADGQQLSREIFFYVRPPKP